MTLQRRAFTSLPGYLQTNRTNLETAVTDDLLYEPEQAEFVSGYIGDTSKLTQQDLQRTPQLIESSPIRQKYQFSIGVAQIDPATQNFISGAFYDDLLNHLILNGGITSDPNRLFSAFFYAWSPPIDYDKIVNPARYFWTGGGTAALNGEYVTKEAAGSNVTLHQFDGTSLVAHVVSSVNGLPGSGTIGEIVEDLSTIDRFFYKWTGTVWGRLTYEVADTTQIKPTYFPFDYIYVCRTGPNFNRPILWVYRPTVGRWVSIPVVVNITIPDSPVVGMVWEDTRVLPSRVLRIYDGNQWQPLRSGTLDVFDGSALVVDAGVPSGTPTSVTYRYDLRLVSAVDSWSAQNWWRELSDLAASDRAALGQNIQAARPIVEFWGNLETASGDVRSSRNQFPLFNLYAVSTSTFDITALTPGNFTGLDTAALTLTGNYVAAQVVSRIFEYVRINGTPDPVLGFAFRHASDGTPEFLLELESLAITVAGSPLLGYRFFRDTSTGLVHSIWEKSNTLLTQAVDSNGLYEIPKNLQFNPDHVLTESVSRSEFVNHFTSVMQSQIGFSGTPFGTNNYRFTPKLVTMGATMIDPEETLFRAMAVLQTNTLDIPDAIRSMSREYNKVMAKFVNQLSLVWQNGTIAGPADNLIVTADQAVDIILTIIFMGRNQEFPFFYSNMGTFTDTRITNGLVYVFDPNPQPIYIPNSASQIGAAPTFLPEKFTDTDGVTKLRGHDGSLIPAYGDARDDILLALETRFFNAVPMYLRNETTTFSSRFNRARFHLADYYGNYHPNLTGGTVAHVVADYTAIVSPTQGERVYSTNIPVFAVWDGTQWLTNDAETGVVFFNTETSNYYIFNGFFTEIIPTENNTLVSFDYSTNEFRQVIQREFERWVVDHGLDFITNNQFSNNDFFTWNFSSAGVEGNYRGIYRRVYRTVRPHSHPWEIAGYSVRPDWWFSHYVPTTFAPDGTPRFTNTHQMWTDLQNGLVNPITNTFELADSLIGPIPVDANGELLDPVTAGMILEQALTPASIADDWQYGDGAPIEDAFYASYFFPFALALAGYLMKPGIFVDRTWSEFYRTIGDTGPNLLWNGAHTVYNTTLNRPPSSSVASQLSLDLNGNVVVNPGFNAWIAEYANLIGVSADNDFNNAIKNSQAALGWKTSGFINARRTKVELLNGDEIPVEDISVVLHQGPSTNEYFQSGIQIVRDTDGFRIFGTDVLNPYFTVELGAAPGVTGQIETIQTFEYNGSKVFWIDDPNNPPTLYGRSAITTTNLTVPPLTNDTAVFSILINGYRIQDKFVQRIDASTFGLDPILQLNIGDRITASVVVTASTPSTQLGSFTINHVTVTYTQIGTKQFVNYPYGTLFETLSDVTNMLVGYGRWLSSQGWVFERLTNGALRDWLGAAKNFVQWATDLSLATRGNAAKMKGMIFEYSVMGRQTQFDAPFGMVLGFEDIRNGAYGVVDSTGAPIRGQHLDVVSSGGAVTVTSDNTDLYGLRLYVSEVQHVVFFPNRTTFNDIIYEPALGLSQPAVFVDTYRTTNWAGRMEAPGFLILGGRLLPNWEKQTNDITRLYDRFNPPDDPVLTAMARDLFGYIPKAYMDELAIDDRSQFNFFHGSLKSKGTFQNYSAFARSLRLGTDNVNISEDWAWKFARYGDERIVTVLFTVNEADFVDTFQTIHFSDSKFSYTFTGDERTTCFVVPQRFVDAELVVQVDGQIKVLGYDYTITPTNTGNSVCFVIPPIHNSTIVMSLNSGVVAGVQNQFFHAANLSGGVIETGMPIQLGDILMFVGGHVRDQSTFSVQGTQITYTGTQDANAFVIGNIGAPLFVQTLLRGDSFSIDYPTKIPDQTIDTMIVVLNGLWLSPGIDYTMTTVDSQSGIHFTTLPPLGAKILLIEAINPTDLRSLYRTTTGDGSTKFFTVPGTPLNNYRHVVVVINGLVQQGHIPGEITGSYSVANGGVLFNSAPGLGAKIILFVVLGATGAAAPVLADDRIIQIPIYSPPNNDGRWVIPPPQDTYEGKPFTFPTTRTGVVDYQKYLFNTFLVDQNTKSPATELFHWDPARDLHEPLALELLDYKTPYDPARYNQGPGVEVGGLVWGDEQIGQVWWDTSTTIYEDYGSFLPDRLRVTREWGRLKYFHATITRSNEIVTVTTLDPHTGMAAPHGLQNGQSVVISGADQPPYNGTIVVTVSSSSTFTFIVNSAADSPATGDIFVQIGLINCYEWVASPVPPLAWSTYVESQSNLFGGYSGIALNAVNASYVSREVWDVNGNPSITYYFWVQNNVRTIPGKDISVLDIAGRLRNPATYEVPYFGIIDSSTLFVFIGADVVLDNYAVELSYYWYEMPRHIEWILFGENDNFVQVPSLVTDKLLDSILSLDIHGNPVPNPTLAPVEKFGSSFFPQQAVFTNTIDALTIFLDAINGLLENVDLSTTFNLFEFLQNGNDELSISNPTGFWSKTTFWAPNVDNTIIYDTVETIDELNLRTAALLYAPGDIVKVIQSDQLDIWNSSIYTLSAVTIVAPGSGYANGDTITLIGGKHSQIAGLSVISNASGAVTVLSIPVIGSYTILPPNPILTLSNGSGIGLTVNGTWNRTPILFAYYQYDGTNWKIVGIEDHTIAINANIATKPHTMRNFWSQLLASFTTLQMNKIIFDLLFEMLRQNPICDWFFKSSYIDVHVQEPIPTSNFVRPDEATILISAILDLKPYRTKLRDTVVTLLTEEEPIDVTLTEDPIQRTTLIFDRLAADLTDENSWDTIPWDATAIYPESALIDLTFLGDGVQSCYTLPEAPPQGEVIVFLNGHLAIPQIDWSLNPITRMLCFTVTPTLGTVIQVLIDSQYVYSSAFEYSFAGNGVKNTEVLPPEVAQASVNDVFSVWNGVHQVPGGDYVVQVTSDTEVLYLSTPSSEVEVEGIVFGGVINDIFTTFNVVSNGVTTQFHTNIGNLTQDTVIVVIDGVWQSANAAFVINTTDSNDNLVVLTSAPAAGADILIYAASNPDFLASKLFQYTGSGTTRTFGVTNTSGTTAPKLMVTINGIKQLIQQDFITTASGIQFLTAPAHNTRVDILAIWSSIGNRLAGVAYPETIQWDYAFWDYTDLGRQEYDFAQIFAGDGVTEDFSLPIPQTSAFLYNIVIKLFLNGVETTPAQLGLTMNFTKLSTAVNVFFSGSLPVNVYGALYLARGLFEGLEPTFGYQDPNGVVFAPTAATYEHFFARLISPTLDPSTIMAGPPPEERIESGVEDQFTIVVRTVPETINLPVIFTLPGQQAIASVANFGIHTDSNVLLLGVAVIAAAGRLGDLNVPVFGIQAIANVQVPAVNIIVSGGDAVTASAGAFALAVAFRLTGVAAQTQFSSPMFTNVIMSGIAAHTQLATLPVSTSRGISVFALAGSFIPTVSVPRPGQEAVSAAAVLNPDPRRQSMSGVQAGTHVGSMSVGIGG